MAPSARTDLCSAVALFFFTSVLVAPGAFAAEDVLPPPMLSGDGAAPTEAALPAAPIAGLVPLRAGARMTYRTTDGQGGASERQWTVLPEVDFQGRKVSALESGGEVQVLDGESRNWMATLRDGKEIEAVEPHRGVFAWPLELGKRWRAEFTYHDRASNFSVGPIGTVWTVAAWERVTTPAGTFSAFRLEGEPAANNTRRTTLWYAPEPGLVVRREVMQATGKGSERATVISELTAYKPR